LEELDVGFGIAGELFEFINAVGFLLEGLPLFTFGNDGPVPAFLLRSAIRSN